MAIWLQGKGAKSHRELNLSVHWGSRRDKVDDLLQKLVQKTHAQLSGLRTSARSSTRAQQTEATAVSAQQQQRYSTTQFS